MESRISIITLGVVDLERSYRFYKEGMGFPTTKKPEDGIIFFQTGGTCLALYPLDGLAEDVDPGFRPPAADLRASLLPIARRARKKWMRCWPLP
ncbi:VOC family protein [uncultured Pseudodesulfovibrio sp.]|uniref:VOC family protein n=1 Tax=uncultured Pseudodesulfovibrio sp. TaxID=2035858 RepID=UPI0029C71872|nr:VOC family protein [uncultured Pseudodesulfovibrio sp.]